MTSSEFVLITGVAGFAGAHVVDLLIKEGHRVRGTVRERTVEIAVVDNIATGDFSEALKDITYVIHVASYLPGLAEPAEVLAGAIDGTRRVVLQAYETGIRRFSITSSIVAALDWGSATPDTTLDENSWNTATRESAIEPGRTPGYVYCTSKALAEKEVWKIAEEHPDIDATVINPSFLIGPNAACQSTKPGDVPSLSTNLVIYNILQPDSAYQTSAVGYVDVRYVGAVLVAGIKQTGKHRIFVTGEWFEFKEAVQYIASVRPELKHRLMTPQPGGPKRAIFDSSRAIKILGLDPVRSWKDNVLETVEHLLKVEKEWKEAGVDVSSTLGASNWYAPPPKPTN